MWTIGQSDCISSMVVDCNNSETFSAMSLLLSNAIEQCDSNQVESLLSSGSTTDINARLPREHSPPPLVYAARCNARDIVAMLLSAGARIGDVDEQRQTACFAATCAQSVGALAVLLAHRPNLEIKDESNRTPLQVSFEVIKNDCIATMLINAGATLYAFAPLHSFAASSTAAIQALLNRGVEVKRLTNNWNQTPLHAASRKRHDADVAAGVVTMLINVCDVDLEAHDVNGQTCTHISANAGSDIVLRCLIDAGADVNCVDRSGQTPLHFVADYKCSILLLAAGAHVNARDQLHRTAFARATVSGSPNWKSILPTFVAAGAAATSNVYERSIDADRVEAARRDIAKTRLDFVRHRALEVCIGLQPLRLDALQLCEILQHACGPLARLIAFHQWWSIATTVKHFHR
jgi:ankyrin repeat protein